MLEVSSTVVTHQELVVRLVDVSPRYGLHQAGRDDQRLKHSAQQLPGLLSVVELHAAN